MYLKQIFGVIALLISFIAYAPYIRDIFRDKTKPHLFSWLVWTILTGISFFSQVAGGAGPGSWEMGITTLICAFVLVLSVKKGTKDIKRIDWVCMLGALSAILLWIITKTPLWSVILVTITDALALFPTVRKSFAHPYEETISLYAINTVKYFLGLFAVQNYSVITALYYVYLVFASGFFVVFLYIRRKSIIMELKNVKPIV